MLSIIWQVENTSKNRKEAHSQLGRMDGTAFVRCQHDIISCLRFTAFLSSGMTGLGFGFQANMEVQLCKVWDGLLVFPRTAYSKRAKLCTNFALLMCSGELKTPPYFESPSSRYGCGCNITWGRTLCQWKGTVL